MIRPAYLLLGDTHGNLEVARAACRVARLAGARMIFQLGDWGYVWPGHDQAEALHEILHDEGVDMIFLDGNHDVHELLPQISRATYPRLTYAARGSELTTMVDGEPFVVRFLGGAASIDRLDRTEGKNWWASERITDAQVERITRCDVLLTHEAPVRPDTLPSWPWPIDRRVQRELDQSQQQILRAMNRARPRRLYHGHLHHSCTTTIDGTIVTGLDADGRAGSMLLVDERFEPC